MRVLYQNHKGRIIRSTAYEKLNEEEKKKFERLENGTRMA